MQPPEVHGRQESRVEEYLRKIVILKQIMSNKARSYRYINAIQNILTVSVSSLLAFFGFSGLDKITQYISAIYPLTKDRVEFGFNGLVFCLFVIGILHLVFHFPQKQASADKAVASLAALGNEIEDMVSSKGNLVISDKSERVDLIRARYEAIAENAPSNSDRELDKARTDIAKKETRKISYNVKPQHLFDPEKQGQIVSSIALGSRYIVDVLIALRDTDQGLWLGGGLIRNAVWDYLHGYPSPTPVEDVDVIFFDKSDRRKQRDRELDTALGTMIPNVRWSVKNQARMHTANGEPAYKTLDEAISKWPETATAFIVRLDNDGRLHFVVPFGFDDLFRLVITNTPAFDTRQHVIHERVAKKNWKHIWPGLKVFLSS